MPKNHASSIFPPVTPLPQILGAPRPRRDVLAQVHSDPETLSIFRSLSPPQQETFLEFCMGNRGLKATYDPFFQNLFDPAMHPGRLDKLLSCIMRQAVRVREVLPRERKRLSEASSLLIMDILVELTDGSLVSVEMQRVGYDFPVERCFCYAADLLVRQYDLVKKQKGKKFSYRHMQPVYVIVLMDNSPGVFRQLPGQYIHRSHFSFGTGLRLRSLTNFIYIPLDIFRSMPHNKIRELDAWLYFLGSDDPKNIQRVVQKYPFFKELYQDIIRFRYQPKEVIRMYSEALAIMDKNTVDFMIDEMRSEIQQQKSEIQQQKNALQQKDDLIRELQNRLMHFEMEDRCNGGIENARTRFKQ